MVRRLRQDARDEIEAVRAAGEREPRLVPVLGGQARHGGCAHVGRVAQNQVIARAANAVEEIRALEVHATPEPVPRDILPGHGDRAGREVDGIDLRGRKRARRENREATAAGAEV